MGLRDLLHKITYKEGENINEEFIDVDEADADRAEARRDTLKSILNGNWLTWDFVGRQRMLILLLAVLSVVYIDNRYRSERERQQVVNLQQLVIDKRYEDLEVSAQLVEMSRQSKVIERLHQYNSKLKESNTPAVKIGD